MQIRARLLGLLGGLVVACLVVAGTPAGAATPKAHAATTASVTTQQKALLAAMKAHSSGKFNINGRDYVDNVASATYNVSWGGKDKVAGIYDKPGMMHPVGWWDGICVPAVTGAVLAVGAAVLGLIAASGGELSLWIFTVGPKTLQLFAAAGSTVSAIESLAAQYVC